jgi:hypothetical protein
MYILNTGTLTIKIKKELYTKLNAVYECYFNEIKKNEIKLKIKKLIGEKLNKAYSSLIEKETIIKQIELSLYFVNVDKSAKVFGRSLYEDYKNIKKWKQYIIAQSHTNNQKKL